MHTSDFISCESNDDGTCTVIVWTIDGNPRALGTYNWSQAWHIVNQVRQAFGTWTREMAR